MNNTPSSNGNNFKPSKGERLMPRESVLIRQYLIGVTLSLGLMFDRLSRMNTDDTYHNNPAAKFGEPVTYSEGAVQSFAPQVIAHDAISGTQTAGRAAEIAMLENIPNGPVAEQAFADTQGVAVTPAHDYGELDQKYEAWRLAQAANDGVYENV